MTLTRANNLAKILLLNLFFIVSGVISAQKIEHVEPPTWWVGMNNPNLQLMVHGAEISLLTAVVDHPGVKLTSQESADSPNYVFLNLKIGPEAKAGKFSIDFKKKNKVKASYEYELGTRSRGSAQRKGFNSSDVIYLVTPDRFCNGNPKNDVVEGMREGAVDRSVPLARHGGDIQGIRDQLDYISELGFTAVWINPLLENDMERASYHGYSTTDYYKIDPRFGSNEEYRAFVAEAKSKGMKVIMDHIVNHCGIFHWWMDDKPFADWINNNGEFVQCTHRRESIQDPYASEFDKRAHSDGWFDTTMPDLNQRNAYLATYLTQNTIWWIEYAGLAGVRQDTYPYPDKQYMSQWSNAIMDEYPNLNIVGEEWSYNPGIVSYWQRGSENSDGYASHLPSVMDFPLQKALIDALQPESGQWSEKFADMYRALANDFQYADPQALVVFADNHDMSRVYKQLNRDFDMWKIAMTYLMVTRGVPQVYYGTEILMADPDGDHGKIREDFPGGWPGDELNGFDLSVDGGLDEQQIEARNYLQSLLQWRKNKNVVHEGELLHFAPLFAGRVYALFRYNEEEAVCLIINKADEAADVEVEKYRELIGNQTIAKDALSGKEISIANSINIPARGLRLLEIPLK